MDVGTKAAPRKCLWVCLSSELNFRPSGLLANQAQCKCQYYSLQSPLLVRVGELTTQDTLHSSFSSALNLLIPCWPQEKDDSGKVIFLQNSILILQKATNGRKLYVTESLGISRQNFRGLVVPIGFAAQRPFLFGWEQPSSFGKLLQFHPIWFLGECRHRAHTSWQQSLVQLRKQEPFFGIDIWTLRKSIYFFIGLLSTDRGNPELPAIIFPNFVEKVHL